MNRPPDILEDPQLRARKVFRDMTHPLIDHPLPAETGPAPFRHIPPAPQRPAPMPGQHTREICHKVLGMSTEETEQLIATGCCSHPNRQPRGRSYHLNSSMPSTPEHRC